MKLHNIILLLLLFSTIFSINIISAADVNISDCNSGELISQSSELSQSNLEISENKHYVSYFENNDSISNEETLGEESTRTIYVDSNKTLDGGNGSLENPFSTLDLACSNVSDENYLTISISNGVYYLDSELKFNTNNLMIHGIGEVVIKCHDTRSLKAFELVSPASNFTMENIIFDASDYTLGVKSLTNPTRATAFFPFYGNANVGMFHNCTFRGFKSSSITGWTSFDSIFSNCIFDGFTSSSLSVFYDSQAGHKVGSPTFINCRFSNINSFIKSYYPDSTNCSFNDCWFGQNTLPSYITSTPAYAPDGSILNGIMLPVSRYAIFSVTENYKGNNTYEIMGKLTWNGTDDQEGMENFQPMGVTLKSTSGDIIQTATLVNGNFRTVYTSSAINHKVTTTLGDEEIELEFTTVNITADPVSIYYGGDQNITFNFTQPVTANVTVTVSNGSYNKTEKVEVTGKDSITYAVPDTLKEGSYVVEINLAENNLFGFKTTTLTVSKVSDYTFDVVAGDVKVGENATISITLPDDVTGTVNVTFGNETKELSANQTMTVNFTNLNATTYSVNVSYSGNDKYVALDKPSSVTVNKADSSLEIENAEFTYGDVIAIPFNVTNANGVTVSVLNKDDDEVATASSESDIINLDTLPAGKYTLEATTIVDSNYEWFSKTIDLTINKANSSIDIQDKEFSYAEDAIINAVTENSTEDVIATLTDENNTEIEVTVSGDTITLPKLNTGKYTLTVTTNPDENHNNVTKIATITINKAAPSMNVIVEPVENITTKDDVTLTISLPSDSTGEVTVKINGKKTDIKSANETITINLNNQAGDYVVDVTYSGDKNYESDMATTEYAVYKAKTSITAKQIAFEEGNASKIEVTVPDVKSGIVLVDVAGKKFYGDIESGKATITLEGVPEGNYTANVKFFGDDKYNPATTTADVKVSEDKIITELKEQLNESIANATDLASQLDDAKANATDLASQLDDAKANATDLASQLDDAKANATDLASQLDDAKANATDLASQLDDAKANATDLASQLDDAKVNATKLSEDLVDANAKVDNLTYELEKAQSNVTVVVDGVEYPVDLVNGTATIKTNKSEPKKASEFTNIVIGENQTISIVLKDEDGKVIANVPIAYTVNNVVNTTITGDDGSFVLKSESGAVITIKYDGNETITGTNTTLTLNNNKVPKVVQVATQFNITGGSITINGYAVDVKAGENGIKYSTELLDINGKPIRGVLVQFAVNNKIYNRTTLENGSITPYNLNMVRAGRYTMAFSFGGNDNYTSTFAVVCVDLDKKPIKINANAKSYKASSKNKKYTVKISTIVGSSADGKAHLKTGMKVTMKVNGKTYTAKTNSNGKATFNLKITKKGKYTATIKTAEDMTYKAANKKVKITIK